MSKTQISNDEVHNPEDIDPIVMMTRTFIFISKTIKNFY